jgi:hypothetical protein
VACFLPSEPQTGSLTASPNPVPAGGSLSLSSSNITDANPGATVKPVVFYYYDSSGNQVTLGTVTASSGGTWTLTTAKAFGLPPGTCTLYARAKDSYGVFGDPDAISLTVQ